MRDRNVSGARTFGRARRAGPFDLNILAIDTSTLYAALAVARADGFVFVASPDPAQRHGRSLVPGIRDLLRASGLALFEIDALAVGLGPGSYTGLRVGLTAAKTLAYTTGKPLVGLDSLEVIAHNAPPDTRRVAAIADAQRGDLYAAEFERPSLGAPLVRHTPTRIESRDAWLACLAPGTLVLGPDLDRLKPPLPDSVAVATEMFGRPSGRHLIALARAALERGQCDDPWFLEPFYLRRSSAEEKAG